MDELYCFSSLHQRIDFLFASLDLSRGDAQLKSETQQLCFSIKENTNSPNRVNSDISQLKNKLRHFEVSVEWLLYGKGEFYAPNTLDRLFDESQDNEALRTLIRTMMVNQSKIHQQIKSYSRELQASTLMYLLETLLANITALLNTKQMTKPVYKALECYFCVQYARIAYKLNILKECQSIFRNEHLYSVKF